MSLPKPPPRHEKRVLVFALLAGAPAVLATAVLLWTSDYSGRVEWSVMTVVTLTWLGFSFAVRERVVFPLRTLSRVFWAMSQRT